MRTGSDSWTITWKTLFLEPKRSTYLSCGNMTELTFWYSPLIELVKTPGRKKAIARKPKIVSKLAHVSEV